MKRAVAPGTPQDGFSMIEALAALALSGLIMGMISLLTAQWIPAWNAGFRRSQTFDLLANALDRMATDIAATEYVSFGPVPTTLFFSGAPGAITFMRRTLSPSSSPGLEVVRLTDAEDEHGPGILRARARFSPALANVSADGDLSFPESVFALRGPYRISFSYLGRDNAWRQAWQDPRQLPSAVRIVASDRATGAVLQTVSTRIHVNMATACVRSPSVSQCVR